MALFSDDARSFWRIGGRDEELGTGNTVTIFITDESNGPLNDAVYQNIVTAVRNVLIEAGGSNNWANRSDMVTTVL